MKGIFSSLLSLWIGTILISPANAQISSDGTTNTSISVTDDGFIINNGDRAGGNLFHSFKEFSVLRGSEAFFNNANNIVNIFSRVTGGNISNIDGLIRANGSANLFLINPAGIIFGENASLHIGGSFYGSTANSILFPNNIEFAASNPVKPILTINAPIGLRFSDNPGDIVSSNNTLKLLKPGTTFALLGGEVTLNNTKIKPLSGRVEIAGVGAGETIQLQHSNATWQFDYSDITNFENIYIGENSEINNSGTSVIMNLRGDNIIINSSRILNSNINDNKGGIISLTATNSIQLNQSLLATQSGLSDGPDKPIISAKENGGDILMNARVISLQNGSIITADNLSEGGGGNINIQAQESLEISDVAKIKSSLPSGEIISVLLPSAIVVNVDSEATGSGGNITITTNRLNITNGGRIGSSTTGIGDAGTITINAKDAITISGNSRNFNSGLYASSSGGQNLNTGESGSLSINTSQLLLQEGGQVSVENLGQKNAGNIDIVSKKIALDSNSHIRANTKFGNGGSINLRSNSILLQGQSGISVDAKGNGNGGNIGINTETLVLLDDNSTIIAKAEAGRGGNIVIQTTGLFPFNAVEKGQIDASSDLGVDGEITIVSPDIDSKIKTNLQEQSPISPEKLMYSGCGLNSDFTANQFRYIGRGGISPSPLTVFTEDMVSELGTVEYIQETTKIEPKNIMEVPIIPKMNHNSPSPNKTSTQREENLKLQEATTWIVNERGNLELVAESPNTAMITPECFN